MVVPPGTAAEPAAAAAAAAKEPPPAYLDEPMDPEAEKPFRMKRIQINQILRSGKFASQQQRAQFDQYYDQYALARWKDLSRTHLLADYRKDLINELKMGKAGAPHQRLVEKALAFFTELAKGSYHPAVRVNAMLVIGDLNERDTMLPTDVPVPLPAALPVLLEAVADPDQLDAVKVVALRGIIRHTTLGIADPNVRDTQVVPAMLALVKTKAEPGRSAEGQAWTRMLAIEALAAAGVLGDQQDPAKVPKALAEVVAEKDCPLIARCAAARALGKLNYPAGLGLDPVALAAELGRLATDGCTAVLKREEEENPVVAVAATQIRSYGGGEDYGDDDDDDDDDDSGDYQYVRPSRIHRAAPVAVELPPTQRLRRRLKTLLQAAWEGLIGNDEKMGHRYWARPAGARQGYQGISVLATAEQQQTFVDDLLERLDTVMDLCDDKETPLEDLMASVRVGLDQLNQTLASQAALPPPAGPPEALAAP